LIHGKENNYENGFEGEKEKKMQLRGAG